MTQSLNESAWGVVGLTGILHQLVQVCEVVLARRVRLVEIVLPRGTRSQRKSRQRSRLEKGLRSMPTHGQMPERIKDAHVCAHKSRSSADCSHRLAGLARTHTAHSIVSAGVVVSDQLSAIVLAAGVLPLTGVSDEVRSSASIADALLRASMIWSVS